MYDDGKLASIRNPEGIWINTEYFREEALRFKKYGTYCAEPFGSPDYIEYWTEQRYRCLYGYTVGGVKITGHHYFYLNFCPIQKVDDVTKKKSKKIRDFPDFWDGDYNYFWVREIAKEGLLEAYVDDEEVREATLAMDSLEQALELKRLFESLHLEVKIEVDYLSGGWNIIVGKSRRKGYSYKSAAVASNNYFTRPESLTIFGAYEKKYLYPKGLFTMAIANVNFINKNTGWAMPSDVINKADHRRASYILDQDGIKIEQGFMSELLPLTFKDNSDAARGKDAEDVFFEESGAFGTPGLLMDSYAATQDCVMAGPIKTGMITIFGTSGDMGGGTADYAYMFENPLQFDLLPCQNIWDENVEHQKVGFFHPINWNMEGHYDKEGNSDREGAKAAELQHREQLKKNGASSVILQKRLQEKPLGPGEAFAAVSTNNFPVVELKRQLNRVKADNLQKIHGTPVNLVYKGSKVEAELILDGSVDPIISLSVLPEDKRGCIMIYEFPMVGAAKGLYKIGYDPVRQDQGTSFAGIIVYKSVHQGSLSHSIPVAEYVGRKESPEDMDRMAEMLAVYFNTKVMHENEVTGVKNYFRRQKKLHLLAHQPDKVISKNVQKSKVARVYGCHMNVQLKDAGERYVKDWLIEPVDFDEHGDAITVIDKIYSIRLLEELINYHRKGNFDLVSALFMCMFQIQEETLGHVHDKEENNASKNAKMLLQMKKDRMSR